MKYFLKSKTGVGKLNIKLINAVEALLFGAGRPLRISAIRSFLELDGLVAELSDIKKCLNELESRYEESSLEISEIASGYRLQIKQEFSPDSYSFME